MQLAPSPGIALIAAACLLGFAACDLDQEAVAPPGAVPVQVGLEVVMADFPPDQFDDADNPGLSQSVEVCENLKPNVLLKTQHLPTGTENTILGDDIIVQNVPSEKPRCRFVANLLRPSADYNFTASVSATPLSAQGWQTNCIFAITHPDLKNAPGNPVWHAQHWVFFFLDQTLTPPIRDGCCKKQKHIDDQPEAPGFPTTPSNCDNGGPPVLPSE